MGKACQVGILFSQVHQTKKAKRFECKLCGEKQSIKRHYGLGTARDCRIHVQKLNEIRGEIDELKEPTRDFDKESADVQPNIENLRPKKSKWSYFVEKPQDTPVAGPSDTMVLNNTKVVLEVRRKVRNLSNRRNFKCSPTSKPYNYNNCENNSKSNVKMEMDSSTPNDSLPFSRQLCETNGNANFIKDSVHSPIKIEPTKNLENKRALKKFVTPVIDSSKWAQFVETEVEPEDDFNDISETIEGENKGSITIKNNSTEDLEQNERCNFYIKNAKSSTFKNSHVTNRKTEVNKTKDISIYVLPTIVKRSSKWASLVETDKYGNKEDTCESIENIDDKTRNTITANTLFNLCEDSELDEILDI